MNQNEEFDFDGTQSKRAQISLPIWDLLSIAALILTACLVGYFVLVFLSPESQLNILPPGNSVFTGPPTVTLTPTPQQLQPTWTASPTISATPSETPRPTLTPLFTDTPFSLVPPTKTPRPPTPTRTPRAPFSVTVDHIRSTIYYPNEACSYFIIGGEALDNRNGPFKFGVVKVGGKLDGKTIDPELHTTVTGVAPQFGSAGFEIKIPELPLVNSNGTVWIQMFDTAGIPLSDKKFFNTYNDCTRNLIQVRFKATRPMQ